MAKLIIDDIVKYLHFEGDILVVPVIEHFL